MAAADTYRYVPAEDDSSGLRPSWDAARRQWKVVALVFVLIVGVGAWYAMSIPPSYAAGAVISFEPRNTGLTGGELASLLTERYPEVVASDTSVEAAAAASGSSPGEIASGLSATIQPDTLNLILQVALPTNDQAVAAATSLNDSVFVSNQADPNMLAVQVSNPTAWGPVGVSSTLLLAAVLLVAVLLAFVAGLVVDGLSRNRG